MFVSKNNLIADCYAKKFSGIEFDTPEKILSVQNFLLKQHVQYLAASSPYYRKMFAENKINIQHIQTVNDLSKLPCTTKSFITNHNKDFLAVGQNEIADVCLTSATTGEIPTMLLQTPSDLARLAYNEEMAYKTMGFSDNDIILITAAIDRCFMAGLAYFLGGIKSGACMVRAGSGSPAQQWNLLKTSKATIIIGVPSLIRKIGEFAIENGENPSKTGIKKIATIGEPTKSEDMQILPSIEKLEKMWNAPIHFTYASTEIATTFSECEERCGGHLRPELVIIELLDDDGNPVSKGKIGEVVVTPLGVQGMPLLRFRTGDISFLINEPCRCGRNTLRIGPILGRKNQMLKFKGTTIFPNAILSILEGQENVIGGYIEVFRNPDNTDRIVVSVALKSQTTIQSLAQLIKGHARVTPEIKIISEEELNNKIFNPLKRKKITFFDMRGNND